MNSRFLSFQVLIYWMDFQWVMGMKKGQPLMRLSPCAGEGHTTRVFEETKRMKSGL